MIKDILKKENFVLIVSTASTDEEANTIANCLVREKLAACVNIVPNIKSIYCWKGEMCESGEWLLLIKSVGKKVDCIISRIGKLHSYEVPEIIALPITGGFENYLRWIKESIAE